MMYVVKVNLYRRNPKVFQRAEVGIRVEELKRKIAQRQQEASRFTSETSKKALELRHHPEEEREAREQQKRRIDNTTGIGTGSRNVRLQNKDFRSASEEDVPRGSMDLVWC
jgi:hypothetical protein